MTGILDRPALSKVVARLYAHPVVQVYGLLLLYLGLSLFKMRAYLLEGRFWAEEGTIYYAAISRLHVAEGLFFVYHGHIELVTNLVVWLATLADLKHAPLVTTYLSFLFQSIPVVVVILFRERLGLAVNAVAAFLVSAVGFVQSPEVWANTINLHFHFAFLAGLIAAMPIGDRYPRRTFRFLLLLSGLSGIPANFLLPLFLLLALKSREKERYVHFAIIAATSMLQIALLAAHRNDVGSIADRSIGVQPLVVWLAWLSQQLFSPLLGQHTDALLMWVLRKAFRLHFAGVLIAFGLVSLIPFLLLGKNMRAARCRHAYVLAGGSLLLLVLSVSTSLGKDKWGLISAGGGGRYFFAPNCMMLLSVLSLSSLRSAPGLLRVFVLLLAMSSFLRIGRFEPGRPWGEAYDEAASHGLSDIEIWPPGWKMPNPGSQRAR